MSGSSSAASEFLSDLPTKQLTEAQLGFVLAVRGLPVGSGEDLFEGDDLRLQVVDLFPPGVLLSPEMMRVPLLHQGLLALLRTNGVTLGGNSDMRSIKRLAATLYPSGADKDFAVSALNGFEQRQVQLCLHGDTAVMPGWPSGLDHQPNHAESRAVLQDSAINAKPVAASSGAMDVLYGGQRWYATNPKDKGGYGSGKPSGRFNPLSVMGCFNCDKPNHSAKDCPEPYNGAKQDARRQEYQAKRSAKRAAVVQVMYELCGQAVALRDGPAGSEMTGEGEVQPEGEQETLFQALMEGAGLMEDASKRGAEMDEQGFQPRE
ncbi:hypothetical protein I4F81_005244 [Pyropia yezoensis]|uniref:Uncharacterized protein n=1 Tax=Pyropia yezoensis TaxID=2788 RepID=A0ACC3BY99_PYRYE|nr:hypothetical protein I4F81_005244 [Neopyropia yezoensis]